MTFHIHIATTFGLLLGFSLVAGLIAERFRLPKVTAYLIVGLMLGPSVLDWIHEDHVRSYEPMLQMAIAMVLFNLGCQFPLRRIRKIATRGLLLSLGEIIATLVLVTGGLLIFGSSPSVALLLGTLAIATAPATTVLVLKEFEAEGPVTEHASFLVALNNFASIVLFELVFLGISAVHGGLSSSFSYEIMLLVRDIFGSLSVGLVTGVLLSFAAGLLSSGHWLVMLVAMTTFLLGICQSLDIPYLLSFLVMGVTVANTSDLAERIVDELDHLTGLLCVLFFAVHGAELDVNAFLTLGLVGGVYIVCRFAGKYVGIWTVASLTGQSPEVRRWLGNAMFPQAGAAIALSTIAVHRNPELGEAVQIIILGSVVVFEIIGPVLIRESVIRAGEVPIEHAIRHTSSTAVNEARELWDHVRMAMRSTTSVRDNRAEITVASLVRKDASAIVQSASFDEVMAYIEHSHDNTYAVVDPQRRVVGLIRYSSLSNVMFDNAISPLVRAEDLATPTDMVLYPDDSIGRVRQLFQMSPDDVLPVVSRESPEEFVGVVRRRDMMHLVMKQGR